MGRLLQLYKADGGAAAVRDGAADEVLELTLADLYARGRRAHPAWTLDDAVFVAHLARCGAAVEAGGDAVHAEDLYLACACLQGDVGALAHARATLRPVLARYLRRVSGATVHVDEVEQRLWEALLIGAPAGPKLATYAGQGALQTWVGISAQRIALMMFRHERAEVRARDEVAAHDRLLPSDPEIAAIKERFRERFQGAIEAALGVLDDRDKTLYRLHLVDGLTLERIGRSYGVSTSTVFRWLESARQRVIEEAQRHLRDNCDLSSGEFESIARLLVSQVDVNLSQVLGKRP